MSKSHLSEICLSRRLKFKQVVAVENESSTAQVVPADRHGADPNEQIVAVSAEEADKPPADNLLADLDCFLEDPSETQDMDAILECLGPEASVGQAQPLHALFPQVANDPLEDEKQTKRQQRQTNKQTNKETGRGRTGQYSWPRRIGHGCLS